jgi:hypothetical protein
MDDPPAVTGQHPAHRGVRGPEEHVLAQAEQMTDVGVDDAAVADDRELLAPTLKSTVQGQDALDHGDHPVPELGAALGERRHVPAQLAVEPLLHAVPHHRRQDVLQPHPVGHVPVRLHLAQFRVDDGFQAVRGRDLTGRFDGPLQVAAQHRGDRLAGQRLADRGRLPLAQVGQRRVRPQRGSERARRHVLLAVPDEGQLDHVRLAGQERPVEGGRRGRLGRRFARG